LKTKGYEAGILDFHKGLHRVRIESYSDYTRALSQLRELRDSGTFPNAWLLKKENG
jgi:hypothetical protein